MPSEFSVEFGSAMLMVRPIFFEKMMDVFCGTKKPGAFNISHVWKLFDSKVPLLVGDIFDMKCSLGRVHSNPNKKDTLPKFNIAPEKLPSQ